MQRSNIKLLHSNVIPLIGNDNQKTITFTIAVFKVNLFFNNKFIALPSSFNTFIWENSRINTNI